MLSDARPASTIFRNENETSLSHFGLALSVCVFVYYDVRFRKFVVLMRGPTHTQTNLVYNKHTYTTAHIDIFPSALYAYVNRTILLACISVKT